jgi:periplasmic protein TonB
MTKPITLVLLAFCALSAPATLRAQDTAGIQSNKDSAYYDRTFTKVEIEASFPGGGNAWLQFLHEHLFYPGKAVRQKVEGTVIVQFVVDKDGNVSDMIALTGDDILREAALKALANTPKWIPAIRDGRKVKSYKKQPVVFKLH